MSRNEQLQEARVLNVARKVYAAYLSEYLHINVATAFKSYAEHCTPGPVWMALAKQVIELGDACARGNLAEELRKT